ncbi:MAG: alpha/beta hydrolase [Chloroflexota bacterium]|nr:alpha/beta hydrolase [Chloroflexota bacterium]
MSAVICGGERVHYEVLGRGNRPVIMLHGWIGSWRYWIPTMQSLQLKYRVYALDLLGFGDSARTTNRYTLEHQIAMLDDFMRELGIMKAALLGHGFGALLAVEFTRRYPERIPRLMLASAPLFDPGNLEHRVPVVRKLTPTPVNRATAALPPVYSSNPESAPTLLSQGEDSSLNAPTVQSPSAAMRAAMAEVQRARTAAQKSQTTEIVRALPLAETNVNNPLARLVAEQSLDALLGRCFKRSEPNFDKLIVDVERTDKNAVSASAQVFDAGSLLDTMRLLPMPTVVVHGADDPLFPLPSDEVWHYITFDKEHSILPVILPGVRHFPMLEDERFVRLATDFLDAPDVSKLEIKERFRRRTR